MAGETVSARKEGATGAAALHLTKQYRPTAAPPQFETHANSPQCPVQLTNTPQAHILRETHTNSQTQSQKLSKVLQTSVRCASSCHRARAALRTSPATDRYQAALHHPARRLRAGWADKNTAGRPLEPQHTIAPAGEVWQPPQMAGPAAGTPRRRRSTRHLATHH